MARPYLVMLLLLNYLLVVGTGMVERPARAVDRPFPYVHSHDCQFQVQHALRLACFDDCNGVQYTLKKHGERPPLQQLLSSLKGLDSHCLPEMGGVGKLVAPVFGRAELRPAGREAAPLAGYRSRVDSPPRRG